MSKHRGIWAKASVGALSPNGGEEWRSQRQKAQDARTEGGAAQQRRQRFSSSERAPARLARMDNIGHDCGWQPQTCPKTIRARQLGASAPGRDVSVNNTHRGIWAKVSVGLSRAGASGGRELQVLVCTQDLVT